MATMINGGVLPRGAVISGEVIRVGGEIRQFAVAACDSDGFGAMEKWRAKFKAYLTPLVLSAGADGSSECLLCTAGRQEELGWD
jgi:hypothetical protein